MKANAVHTHESRQSPSVLVAQLGARMHYAVPRILHTAGMLDRLVTDICATKGITRSLRMTPPQLLPRAIRRLRGRVPKGVPPEKIVALSGLGLRFSLAQMRATTSAQLSQVYLNFGREFCERINAHGFGAATAVYTFNGAGLELLQAAKERGLTAYMEQTIAPRCIERELLEIEAQKHPEWAISFDPQATEAISAREAAEWRVADRILCGSQFVIDGIQKAGGPVDKCVLVPYGVEPPSHPVEREVRTTGPLRVLTVGALGLRKGTPYVIAAARELVGQAEFKLVGPGEVPVAVRSNLPPNLEVVGQVPRTEVQRHFRWAEVFVLPSICEGSATVTYEALLWGLPVICTPNTGSLVTDGVDGLIIPAGSQPEIVSALLRLAADESSLGHWRAGTANARTTASEQGYAIRLVNALQGEPAFTT